jgi:hypothetical protein
MHQVDCWRRFGDSVERLQRSQSHPGLQIKMPLRLLKMPDLPEKQPELRLIDNKWRKNSRSTLGDQIKLQAKKT